MKRALDLRVTYLFLLAFVFLGSVKAQTATEWQLSKPHSSVNFKVWHLMTPVYGSFNDFDAEIHFDPQNLTGSSIKVTIQAESINTGFEPRDKHLKTVDWFDADRYPLITFTSSEIMAKGDSGYVAKGKLNMKGVEKEVELPFKLLGIRQIPAEMKDTFGGADEVASFEISNFLVNRKDYNIGTGTSSWETAARVYNQVVGSDVLLNIAIEASRNMM